MQDKPLNVNSSIFKSYDIRGIYPSELNEEIAYYLGRTLIVYVGAKRIVVGRDGRLSSPQLSKFFAKGAADQGAVVTLIGQIPTECLYFALGSGDYDAGVTITASHNPKEYNGIKMMRRGINSIRGKDLWETFQRANFPQPHAPGKVQEKLLYEEYISHIFSLIDLSDIKDFKTVIDTSNGMAGLLFPMMQEKLPSPLNTFLINSEVDGNFPGHSPNPLHEGIVEGIAREIKKEKAACGFIFDGDADRVFLVDEKGNLVGGDIVLLLLAQHFLKKYPGAAVAFNATCSRTVPEFITKWGGKPVRTKVGFVNVREGLISNKGVLGGEVSGHYCFKDYFYADSGFLAFFTLLKILKEDGRPVSKIIQDLNPYFKSDINFKTGESAKIIEEIKKKYSQGKQDYLDGVTVEYQNWWFNVRASNTEPLLRLTVEANTRELLQSKKDEISKLVQSLG